MTENLRLHLTANEPIIASKNDGSTFSYTPTSCSQNGQCALNGNTQCNSVYGQCYYNWYVATAGEGDNSNAGYTSQSICPKGWKIPSDVADKSFTSLMNSYGTSDAVMMDLPLSFAKYGNVQNGGFNSNSVGYSQAITNYAYSLTNYKYFDFHGAGAHFEVNAPKAQYGHNIRCIAL